MKTTKKCVLLSLLLVGLILLSIPQTVMAAGTASGTSITNRATVEYQVNSVDQTEIESSPTGNSTAGSGMGEDTTFLVDNKVDLTVTATDGAIVSVTPGSNAQVLTYSVTNNGNTVQDYSLAATHSSTGAFGETETFDATNVNVYVEDGTTPGSYQSGEDTETRIDELAPDASITVYVVADIPVGQVNNDVSSLDLTATTRDGGSTGVEGSVTSETTGADDPASVDVVFADGAGTADSANDGKHSDLDGYKCASASLTVTKSTLVISDPINGSSNPKAIPGAIIEHTITVVNASSAGATATSIQVSDDLSTEIGNGTIAFEADGYAVGYGIQLTAPNLYGGAATSLTNSYASGDDEGDFNDTAANTVTVTGIDLAASETATVKFRVEIQ